MLVYVCVCAASNDSSRMDIGQCHYDEELKLTKHSSTAQLASLMETHLTAPQKIGVPGPIVKSRYTSNGEL